MSDVNFNYTNLTPFKWYVLENFPFIEADFDALTNWQLFCKLGKEINKIIPAVNSVGTQTENLTTFVTNYFNNLDVQEEINNKLDEMTKDGTLQEIITQYLQVAGIVTYENVEIMKNATNLINGSTCKTLGFYELNDNGGALYKIREVTNEDNVDNMFLIKINNSETLVAELLIEDLNIKQLGAKGDNKTDETNIFQKALEKCDSILIPEGTYIVTQTLNISHQKTINGKSLNSIIQYNGNGYLFNITTAYNNPCIISNITLRGNELNNCIICNKNEWGGSFNLFNFAIQKFNTALNIVSNYNNFISDGLIMCDGKQIISNVYDEDVDSNLSFSNNLLFQNVHFKKWSNNIDTIFNLNNAQYFNFINCTFEFCNLVFDLTRSKVFLNNCWCEASNYLYKYNDTLSFVKSNGSNLIITNKDNFNANYWQYSTDIEKYYEYNNIRNTDPSIQQFYQSYLNRLISQDKHIYHQIRTENGDYSQGETLYELSTQGLNCKFPVNVIEEETATNHSLTINFNKFTEQYATFLIIAMVKTIYNDDSEYYALQKFIYTSPNSIISLGNTEFTKKGETATNDRIDITSSQNSITASSVHQNTTSMVLKLMALPFGKANFYYRPT